MAPIPDENQDNPADNDPGKADIEELETPHHIIPPAHDSSSEDDDFDSDAEGPPGDGYMLLPQGPEEDDEGIGGGGEGSGGRENVQSHAFPPPSALDGYTMPSEPMTEVRGAGVDLTEAVAQGNVHPAFVANFADNKVPVHLQVPDLPKTKKGDVLWNQASSAGSQRLQMDSDHLDKVKSAMAGFQLPAANIPDWVKQIPEDQWKRRLVDRLTTPQGAKKIKETSIEKTNAKPTVTLSVSASCTDGSAASQEKSGTNEDWPGSGTNGT